MLWVASRAFTAAPEEESEESPTLDEAIDEWIEKKEPEDFAETPDRMSSFATMASDEEVAPTNWCTLEGWFFDSPKPLPRKSSNSSLKKKRRNPGRRRSNQRLAIVVETPPEAAPAPATARVVAEERPPSSPTHLFIDVAHLFTDHNNDVRLWRHYFWFMTFVVLCAVALSFLEYPKERRIKNREYRRGVRIKRVIDMGIEEGWFDEDFKKDVKHACDFVTDDDRKELRWDVPGSMFFVATIVTTIGYGNYAPQTPWGKILTCLIAILGVAWFGYILTVAADRLEHLVRFVVLLVRKGYRFTRSKLTRLDIYRTNKELFTPKKNLQRILGLNVLFIVSVSVYAYYYGLITIGNAFYLAIITFSTVGLGDYAPPFDEENESSFEATVELLALAALAMTGLTLLASLLRAVEAYSASQVKILKGGKSPTSRRAMPGFKSDLKDHDRPVLHDALDHPLPPLDDDNDDEVKK
ncbi:hypothetical protein CTAYLR_009328 [Chrysophaeum taylorii]|uniref:Potassium channel domain-containing protein n=1 Tax=Chrysophaeum taylorii TaxID=2483200 RepID=A0AAD7UJ74_9STRA|nr:hypothetical protein CTAYLR_009328 [Chrysophaeum taylorii]